MIYLYTDGANSLKTKVGGYAAILVNEQDELITTLVESFCNRPTNNMVELAGVIFGLDYIINHPELGKEVTVISDSEYVVLGASERLDRWIAKGWKCTTGPVKNKPLWEAINSFKSQLNITWKWVRGHNGNKWNEKCDTLAVASYKKLLIDNATISGKLS